MRADVPVGAFLSSGIDSTAIVALARGTTRTSSTFTVGFDATGYSEIDVAPGVGGRHRGRAHHRRSSPPQDMMATLPRIVWHLDDPVADPALVPLYFVAREAAQARHGGAVRRGRRRVLRRLHDLPRAAVAGRASTGCPAGMRRGAAARWPRRSRTGMRGKELPASAAPPRSRSATTATPASSRGRRAARAAAPDDPSLSHTDVTAPLYAQAARRPRRRHHDAVRRPATPGCAATSWSRPTGCRWRTRWSCGCRSWTGRCSRWPARMPGRPEAAATDDDQVRAAPGADADRAAAHRQPAQARLPGADPGLARPARCTTGRGRSSPSAGPRVAGPSRGARLLDAHRGTASGRPTTPARSGRCWSS